MPGVHKAVLSQPPSSGQGENNVEKTPHGSRWFNKEKKNLMHMGEKGNQRFFSLFSVSIRCPTACQEARFQHTQCLLWKINIINNECLLFLLFSLRFYIWADTVLSGTTFWSFEVSCPGYVTSQNLTQPSANRWVWGALRDRVDAVPALLSSSQKNWCVIITFLATDAKHGTVRAAVGRKTPSHQTQYNSILLKPLEKCISILFLGTRHEG